MLTAIDRPMLAAQSALNAVSTAIDVARLGLVETTHYIDWSNGISAGAVIIETASDPLYAGTWAPVQTVTYAAGSPKQEYVRVQGQYKALRHRISTGTTGGTVSSRIVGSS
jgi:hypothetical protein